MTHPWTAEDERRLRIGVANERREWLAMLKSRMRIESMLTLIVAALIFVAFH